MFIYYFYILLYSNSNYYPIIFFMTKISFLSLFANLENEKKMRDSLSKFCFMFSYYCCLTNVCT